MAASALFGRYVPGESPLHRLDPRTKVVGVLCFIIIVFCAQTPAALCVCGLFLLAVVALSGIGLPRVLRAVAPLLFIVVLTALLNLFWVQGGTALLDWGPVHVGSAGVSAAAFIGCRLFLLLSASTLMTLVTTTLDTTDAVEALLQPARRIGFPAHEFAMMMGITLRFMPLFADELGTIRRAQESRGARLGAGPFHGGFRMMKSLIVPLFASAFRHAETLSAGMDARCYHGGVGRTTLHPLHFGTGDAKAAGALVAYLFAILAANLL